MYGLGFRAWRLGVSVEFLGLGFALFKPTWNPAGLKMENCPSKAIRGALS